jgi:hypothetical protein
MQNVDDNVYEASVTPTLHITLTKGMLRIDCNELGFNRKNVESLCSIGQSSKNSGRQKSMYIGQKGIGFKSVFRVADVVHICSGHYSFKFDKSTPLGMLVPIWSNFPQNRLPGTTSMLLQLSDKYNTSNLIRELKSMEPPLLIFMNKLREIHVQVRDSEWTWRSALWSKPNWTRRLKRNTGAPRGSVRETVVMSNKTPLKYWVASYEVDDIPKDPRREGCDASKVLVGFPIEDRIEEGNDTARQLVFAFLPVGDYGFKVSLCYSSHGHVLTTLVHDPSRLPACCQSRKP